MSQQDPFVRSGGGLSARLAAVADVLIVFIITFTFIWLTALLPIGKVARWFLSYAVMIGIPLLILMLSRRNLREYGLVFDNLKPQMQITAAVFLPVILESMVYGWLLPIFIPQAIVRWEGALILCLVEVAVFFWIAWILRKKPSLPLALPIFLAIIPFIAANPNLFDRLLGFFFYLLFLGPGEEFLFRGYIQSRLNTAFGRPYIFWEVSWGWGLVIASLIFGAMHILNLFNPFQAKFDLTPWWGVWTFFGGLTLGYIREKANSILPSAILHGLPQAIAALIFGFFSVM